MTLDFFLIVLLGICVFFPYVIVTTFCAVVKSGTWKDFAATMLGGLLLNVGWLYVMSNWSESQESHAFWATYIVAVAAVTALIAYPFRLIRKRIWPVESAT